MAVLAGDATEPKAELPVARAFRTMAPSECLAGVC